MHIASVLSGQKSTIGDLSLGQTGGTGQKFTEKGLVTKYPARNE